MAADLTTGNQRSDKLSLIVGIGASAGGLKPLQSFLDALPKEFGFVLVFIQHLSATHKSLLAELCQSRRPDLDCVEITDGLAILPERLYLCPPGQFVTVQNGSFRVNPPPAGPQQLPIDEFFISLAEEAGEKATAVIFSGAGTDGARGIGAIRSKGGTVFVQDPETAEFPSMPLAAIGTGQVDKVLPPADIVREVVKTLAAAALPAGVENLATAAQFQSFFRLIYEKTGHRFEHYKPSVIARRIRRRMYLHGLSSLEEYLKMIGDRDAEAVLLASDIMIGVTSFYRDRAAWTTLRTDIISKFGTANEDVPIRVWTPACATGEEAYSIAMMLCYEFELACRRKEVQVFATDVNDRALDKAREGKYPGSITADVPPEYMRKFFTCSEDGLFVTISKEIRERVVFARQDLLVDPPFSRLDLIICRNLLIYLEPEAQEKCISLFHYALKDGGYLFLGNAESVTRNNNLFKPLGYKKCRIYQKLEGPAASRLPVAAPFAAERPVPSPASGAAETRQTITGLIQEALLESHAPAAVAINQDYEILYHNGPTQRYLRQPRGTPTQNLLELLPENLRNRLRGGLYRATAEARPVSVQGEITGDEERQRQVALRISKLRDDLFLIVFQEAGGAPDQAGDVRLEAADLEETAVRQLESELAATKDALQNTIEQLRSMNEELQSSNEELHAANEELETSREELQSLNEELITVNGQLQGKIEEQEGTNNDLNNFLASTNIPTLFLDHQFKLKRFTPAMSKLLKLLPSDVGRSIIDMSQESLGPELIADTQAVLDSLVPIRKELLINGDWYVRAALPYRTLDDRIEGVVVTYTNVTELKQVEARTRHLASFPQLNPNPIVEVDAAGKLTFINPGAEKNLERLGLDKGEAAVFLPQDLEIIWQEMDKGRELSVSREVTIKDRVFSETIHLLPQFQVVRIYALDITERQRAEAEHVQLSQQRQLALDAAHLGWWHYDPVTKIASWDDRYREIFGVAGYQRPNDEILAQLVHPDDRPGLWAKVEAALDPADPQPFAAEYRINRPDGSLRWVEAYGIASFEGQGQYRRATSFVGTVADITARKQAEQELQRLLAAVHEERDRLSSLINSMSDEVWFADASGKFSLINPAGAQEFLLDTAEQINVDELAASLEVYRSDGSPRPVEEAPPLRALAGEVVRGEEEVIRTPGTGELRHRQVSAAPVRDAGGKIIGSVSVVRDITDLKRSEEELRASNDELLRINQAMEGRELRMIELKKEINELRIKTGEPPPYPLEFENNP